MFVSSWLPYLVYLEIYPIKSKTKSFNRLYLSGKHVRSHVLYLFTLQLMLHKVCRNIVYEKVKRGLRVFNLIYCPRILSITLKWHFHHFQNDRLLHEKVDWHHKKNHLKSFFIPQLFKLKNSSLCFLLLKLGPELKKLQPLQGLGRLNFLVLCITIFPVRWFCREVFFSKNIYSILCF